MESTLISQFMEITACDSQVFAVRQLSSCQWNLETAVNLFFAAGGVVPSPTEVASPPPPPPPPPAEEKEEEVRAPIPTRVERLCEYYSSSRTERAAQSMWKAPPPKPVPVVPMQGILDYGCGVDEQVSECGEAIGDHAEERKSDDGNQDEARNDVQEEEDPSGVKGYGVGSDGDKVDEEDYNEHDEEYYNEHAEGDYKEHEDEDYNEHNDEEDCNEHEEEVDNNNYVSDNNDSEMEDYGLEIDEDDDYHDMLMTDEDDEPVRRPDSLEELFSLPFDIMFRDTFHQAKLQAATQDRFLLVNLQAQNFRSCMHNRDLWTNDVVKQTVKDNFVFQLFTKLNDYVDEGTKVCTFYKIQDDQLPALLVLDPITGQMLSRMSGAIEPDEFMLFVEKYTRSKPSEMSMPKIVPKTVEVAEVSETAISSAGGEQATPEGSAAPGASGEEQEQEPVSMVEEEEPADAEMVDSGDDEPEEGEKMYKLRVRFPDGSVVPKEFGCKRRVSKLFAFCRSAVGDAGKNEKGSFRFRIMMLAGRAFEEVQNSEATFEELGLNFATVSVVFVT